MAQPEQDIEAVRQILVNWAALSAGDISTLFAALDRPSSHLVTTLGTPNCLIWERLERLDWARTAETSLPPQVKVFSLTSEGEEMLPRLIQRFGLRHGNSYREDARR